MQYYRALRFITNVHRFVFIQFRSLGVTDDSDSLLRREGLVEQGSTVRRRQACAASTPCMTNTNSFVKPRTEELVSSKGAPAHALAGRSSRDPYVLDHTASHSPQHKLGRTSRAGNLAGEKGKKPFLFSRFLFRGFPNSELKTCHNNNYSQQFG